MEILFLDAAANLGWAFGPAGKPPTSGSVRVWDHREHIGIACGRLTRWLARHVGQHHTDLIGIEQPQSSAALRSGQGNAMATDAQLRFNGAIHGFCGEHGFVADEATPGTIRKLTCGRAFPVRTSGEDTKPWVARHMVLIGFLPKDFGKDYDRSDAVAGFAYMSAIHGRASLPLVLVRGKRQVMSLLPEFFHVGKRCLMYCGDDRCNCDRSPRYVPPPGHSDTAKAIAEIMGAPLFGSAEEMETFTRGLEREAASAPASAIDDHAAIAKRLRELELQGKRRGTQ